MSRLFELVKIYLHNLPYAVTACTGELNFTIYYKQHTNFQLTCHRTYITTVVNAKIFQTLCYGYKLHYNSIHCEIKCVILHINLRIQMTTASVYSLSFNQGKTREGSCMNFLHRTSMFMTHIQYFFLPWRPKCPVSSLTKCRIRHSLH